MAVPGGATGGWWGLVLQGAVSAQLAFILQGGIFRPRRNFYRAGVSVLDSVVSRHGPAGDRRRIPEQPALFSEQPHTVDHFLGTSAPKTKLRGEASPW